MTTNVYRYSVFDAEYARQLITMFGGDYKRGVCEFHVLEGSDTEKLLLKTAEENSSKMTPFEPQTFYREGERDKVRKFSIPNEQSARAIARRWEKAEYDSSSCTLTVIMMGSIIRDNVLLTEIHNAEGMEI